MFTTLWRSAAKQVRSQWMGALALFLVLTGGTALAVTQLSKNSVRSKHIVNGQVKRADLATGAVNSAKVADGTLLGSDFAPGQAPAGPTGPEGPAGPQGPAGPTGPAGTAAPATFIDAGLPETITGSGICASAFPDWVNSGPGLNHLSYYRDERGLVYLRGEVTRCRPSTSPIYQLPAGFRPTNRESFAVPASPAIETLRISSSGEIRVTSSDTTAARLSGLVFRCGPAGQDGCP